MNKFGQEPTVIDHFDMECPEMMAYLYLPIKMANKDFSWKSLPKRLSWLINMIKSATEHEKGLGDDLRNKYIYVTAKHLYATPDNPVNRPGWHGDGFGTNDVNYIWCDVHPTLFAIQEFKDISKDHQRSMEQIKHQAKEENVRDFGAKNLLRLTQYNIHRTPDIEVGCMRTFVKISISPFKYNLKGNSHNYKIDYNWNLYNRSELRNDPHKDGKDFLVEGTKPQELEFMFWK